MALEQGAIAGDAIARALASGDFRFADHRCALCRSVVGRELIVVRWLAARVYQRGERWQRWLAMMLFDRDFLDLYAARGAGANALADQRLRLAALVARHGSRQGKRLRQLRDFLAEGVEPAPAGVRMQ